jgi:hypothetical protein
MFFHYFFQVFEFNFAEILVAIGRLFVFIFSKMVVLEVLESLASNLLLLTSYLDELFSLSHSNFS